MPKSSQQMDDININLVHSGQHPSRQGVMSSSVVLGPDLEFTGSYSIGWNHFQVTVRHCGEAYPLRFVFKVSSTLEEVTIGIMGEDRDGDLFVPEQKITPGHWAIGYVSRLVLAMIGTWGWDPTWKYNVAAHFMKGVVSANLKARVVFDGS